jgi:hypothetical protein
VTYFAHIAVSHACITLGILQIWVFVELLFEAALQSVGYLFKLQCHVVYLGKESIFRCLGQYSILYVAADLYCNLFCINTIVLTYSFFPTSHSMTCNWNRVIKQLKSRLWSSPLWMYPFRCSYITAISVKISLSFFFRRSERPRDLRHELSSPAQTLGSWVRIPL